MLKIFLLILFLLFLTNCSIEKKTNNIKGTNTIITQISYLKDFQQKFNYKTIKNQSFSIFSNPKLGHNNGWYWFKIKLKDSLKTDEIIIDIEGNTIDSLYIFNNNHQILFPENKLNTSGSSYKVYSTKNRTYFAKVHFQKQVYFPFKVFNVHNFYNNKNISFFKNGLFYGFVIIIFLVNIIFYFSLKDITFLTYAIFLALTNVGMTDYDGLMGYYTSPETRYFLSIGLHFLVPLGTAVFTSTLLSHHTLVPKSVKIATGLFSLSAFFYILFIFTKDFLFFAIGDFVGLIIFSYYMYLGIFELKRQKFAKFSVLGYSLIWISGLLFVIPLNWGFKTFSLPLESVKMGSVFEMLVLTYAITYRVKILHKENKRFGNEIKKHLKLILDLEEKLESNEHDKYSSVESKIESISKKNNLTERESDILLQIINGLNNHKISEKLFISINTVKFHTRNIYEKLNIKKRTEIAPKILFDK
jgi:DNA-binding CsgD family transcriptional regulator